MDNEKLFYKLVSATFIMSVAVLVLAIVILIRSFMPVTVKPAAKSPQKQEQPQAKISESYAKQSMRLDEAIAANKPVAVFFYVDWCGFCQRFAPVFYKLSMNKDLKNNYNFVYVNCDDANNREYLKQYKIEAYPTLYLVNPKTKNKVHVANHTMFAPNVQTVLKDEFNKFLK